MFSKAYEKATSYTYPIVISTRTFDNKINCSVGAYVIINNEGWVLTVAHILSLFLKASNDIKEYEIYKREINKIKTNKKLNHDQIRKRISKIKPHKDWIVNHSFWWGKDNYRIDDFIFCNDADIAIGKIIGYKNDCNQTYPKFIDPKNLKVATSLCKLGYPFNNINAQFDEKTNSFKLDNQCFPLSFFPIEGIYTRNINIINKNNDQNIIKFMETSSPGLKGQSGGPIFDKNAIVWSIQSRTQNFELGFVPSVNKNNKHTEEHQFLNVGWGLHPEVIHDFLKKHNVKFEIASKK